MTEMTTVHAVDHRTAKHNGTWLYQGAGVNLRCYYGAIGALRDIAEALGCAVTVMPDANGLLPEDHPQYTGIYWGPVRGGRHDSRRGPAGGGLQRLNALERAMHVKQLALHSLVQQLNFRGRGRGTDHRKLTSDPVLPADLVEQHPTGTPGLWTRQTNTLPLSS
jgi:hypothetical protein